MRNEVFNGIRNLGRERRRINKGFILPPELIAKAKELGIKNDVNELLVDFPIDKEGTTFVNAGFEGNSKFSKLFSFDGEMNVFTPIGKVRSIKNLITFLQFGVDDRIYYRSKPYYSKTNLKPRSRLLNSKSIVLMTILLSIKIARNKRETLISSGSLPITCISKVVRYDRITDQKVVSYNLLKNNGRLYVGALRIARMMLLTDMFNDEMISKVINANLIKGIPLYQGFGIQVTEEPSKDEETATQVEEQAIVNSENVENDNSISKEVVSEENNHSETTETVTLNASLTQETTTL